MLAIIPMALEIQKGEGEFSHAPMNPSSPLPSPGPSPTVSSTAPALILSNSGKIMDQSGTKKKYVKQVTGRHNLTELHLAAQRGDLAAVRLIPSEIDAQMTGSAGEGEEFDAEVAEIRSAVVNEVEETLLMIAAERGFLDVVVKLLKYSDRESVSRKNKSEYDALHSAARGGHRVKSVRNLNGHSIGPYQIHAGRSVPIVKGGKQTKMDEDNFFTIETFASTGYVVVEAELQGADFWRQGYS